MVTSRREKAKVQEKGIKAARRSCAKALVLVPLDSLYQLKSTATKGSFFLFTIPSCSLFLVLFGGQIQAPRNIYSQVMIFFFFARNKQHILQMNNLRKMLTDVEVVFERSLILKMNNLSCRSIYCTYII